MESPTWMLPPMPSTVDAYDQRMPISRSNVQPACRAVPEELAVFEAARARSDGASRHRACFGRHVISALVGVFFPRVIARHTPPLAPRRHSRAPPAL